jgi:CheY-like chemotaxis protein
MQENLQETLSIHVDATNAHFDHLQKHAEKTDTRPSSIATQSAEQQETSVPRKHIMLVEDDPNNAEALDLLLQTTNSYQRTYFRTGSEAVANLDKIKSLSPVLFLLDYTLPHMTGFDLYKQLHTTEGLENVPTIILSGSRISDPINYRNGPPPACRFETLFRGITKNKPYRFPYVLLLEKWQAIYNLFRGHFITRIPPMYELKRAWENG